jgi:serine/threonine-protein kinase
MVSAEAGGASGAGTPGERLGEVLGDRFRLVRLVGAGAGRARYAAEHTLDARAIDVVVFPAGAAPEAVERFLETERVVARVGHENVAPVLNGGRAPDGAVFVATEFVGGVPLAEHFATEPPLPWERAQAILGQLVTTLGAHHRQGVVHGDVRPEVVRLLARDGRRDLVRLEGFGAGALAAPDPLWAAPEVVAGAAPDARSDVFALGALAYRLVTGERPFKDAEEPPAPPTSLRPAGTLPADLDAVLLRALEKAPESRWPDMAAFGDALARCRLTRRQSVRVEALAVAEKSGGTRTATGAFEAAARRRRRGWNLAAVAAAVVLAILGLRILNNAPGHVSITTVPADAELTFNGLPVAARSPVVLDASPGRYVLVVKREGFTAEERTVDVGARAEVEVSVVLAPKPAAASAALPSPQPAP